MLIRQFARHEHALREVSFIPNVTRSADGSCVIKSGDTHILCTACFDLNATGLHVEFGKLPGSEQPRIARERDHCSFETLSIQNTIYKSLTIALELDVLQKVGLFVDCDVLQSAGSIKTSSVSGAFVAVALAFKKCMGSTLFPKLPLLNQVAGISCGFLKERIVIDLDYQEAQQADVVGDFIFSSDEQVVSIDITAQKYAVPFDQIHDMENMALRAVRQILEAQKRCLNA